MPKQVFPQHRPALTLLAAGLLFATTGCGGGEPRGEFHGTALEDVQPYEGDGPIRVVCTTGMVADLVRNAAGDQLKSYVAAGETFDGPGERIEVVQLMGEGVDPHLYKATPGDVRLLDEADLIVFNGLHLEGKLGDVFARMGRKKAVFPVAGALPEDELIPTGQGTMDPHVWMDVSLWAQAAERVGELLARLDPDRAEEYRANARACVKRLEDLHTEIRERVQTEIPDERQRVLVTAHDAFHYFGRAYGLEVKAIQGISTETEAGVREVNELVEFLVENGIKAVFVESSVSDRNVQSLIDGCRQRGHEVQVGGELYSDAMGKPGTEEGTYEGMLRHNAETIVSALK